MNDIVDMTKYLRSCQNCIYHDPKHGACNAPNGYDYDWRIGKCFTFCRREATHGKD